MEEIPLPVEYNIIIETLNPVVQHQHDEGNESHTNFQYVINTNGDHCQDESTLECIQQSHQRTEDVNALAELEKTQDQATIGDSEVSTDVEQDGGQGNFVCVETTQPQQEEDGRTCLDSANTAQAKKKTYNCDICSKTFLHAGTRIVV